MLFWPLVCNRQRALCGRGLVWVMTTWLLWIMPWLLWYCGFVEGRAGWWPEVWEEWGLYWGWFPDEDRTMGRPELGYACPGTEWPGGTKTNFSIANWVDVPYINCDWLSIFSFFKIMYLEACSPGTDLVPLREPLTAAFLAGTVHLCSSFRHNPVGLPPDEE